MFVSWHSKHIWAFFQIWPWLGRIPTSEVLTRRGRPLLTISVSTASATTSTFGLRTSLEIFQSFCFNLALKVQVKQFGFEICCVFKEKLFRYSTWIMAQRVPGTHCQPWIFGACPVDQWSFKFAFWLLRRRNCRNPDLGRKECPLSARGGWRC